MKQTKQNTMKNKIFAMSAILTLCMGLISCDPEDGRIIFDPSDANNQILIGFDDTSVNFSVEVGETRDFEFLVNTSTLSNVPRTVNLVIDESSTLNPDLYSLSSLDVVIPANEFFGTGTITITDAIGLPSPPETLTLNIVESNDFLTQQNRSSININASVIGPFSGTYDLTVLEGVFPGFDATVSYPDGIVEIAYLSETDRSIIDLCYLPEFGTFCGPFNFSIDGNEIVVPSQAPGGAVGCGGGAAIISQSFPDDQATVDLEDDSVFQIIFQDNIDNLGGCNVDSYRVVFELTKQ